MRVTEFNVGRFCKSEDDCIADGIDFAAYERGVADAAAAFGRNAASPAVAPSAQPQWRCFHCNEVFATEDAASEHFGPSEHAQPACQIDIAEYRRMQEAHRRQCEDDTDWHRAFYRLGSRHQAEMQTHGEIEYARGLRDGVNLPAGSPERAALTIGAAPSAQQPQAAGESERQITDDEATAIHRMPYVRDCLLRYFDRPGDDEAASVVKAIATQVRSLLSTTSAPAQADRPAQQEGGA